MYIVECHKCGNIKVISSIENENGVTRATWCCSNCGAGEIVEVVNRDPGKRSELTRIIKGLGFIVGNGEQAVLYNSAISKYSEKNSRKKK